MESRTPNTRYVFLSRLSCADTHSSFQYMCAKATCNYFLGVLVNKMDLTNHAKRGVSEADLKEMKAWKVESGKPPPKVLANFMEALIGALYLVGGFTLVCTVLYPILDKLDKDEHVVNKKMENDTSTTLLHAHDEFCDPAPVMRLHFYLELNRAEIQKHAETLRSALRKQAAVTFNHNNHIDSVHAHTTYAGSTLAELDIGLMFFRPRMQTLVTEPWDGLPSFLTVRYLDLAFWRVCSLFLCCRRSSR